MPKSKTLSDVELANAIRAQLDELATRAATSKVAAAELEMLSRATHSRFMRNAGPFDLLGMADYSICRLYEIAQAEPEKLRPYAKSRMTWPAYIALTESIERGFIQLRGAHDKAGKRIDAGPIELGKALPFQVNRRTTNGIMLKLATAAFMVLNQKGDDWRVALLIEGITKRKNTSQEQARAYLGTLPPIRDNWNRWQPIFDRYITMTHGPSGKRWELIPANWRDNFFVALQFGVAREWIDNYATPDQRRELLSDENVKRSLAERPVYEWVECPEIAAIVRTGKAKSKQAQWSNFKNRLLRKCEELGSSDQR